MLDLKEIKLEEGIKLKDYIKDVIFNLNELTIEGFENEAQGYAVRQLLIAFNNINKICSKRNKY